MFDPFVASRRTSRSTRHRQHADLRARQGDRPRRAFRRRHPPEGGPNGKKTIQAVGAEAKAMLGKVPGNIETIRPMKDNVIADFTVTEQMLKFIKMVHPLHPGRARGSSSACPAARPRSSGARSASRRSARRFRRLPDRRADGGGDRRRAAGLRGERLDGRRHRRRHYRGRRISLGGMVYKLVRVGGDKFDEAIINYIRRNYGMLIGEPTAEMIRRDRLASRLRGQGDRGQGPQPSEGVPLHDLVERDPRGAHRSAQPDRLERQNALEQTPPELGADIAERGMMPTGGGASCATSIACSPRRPACRCWSAARSPDRPRLRHGPRADGTPGIDLRFRVI
jgi:rod shape-determining protein MreB